MSASLVGSEMCIRDRPGGIGEEDGSLSGGCRRGSCEEEGEEDIGELGGRVGLLAKPRATGSVVEGAP
eukprot:13479250-Alexandrium_andersonii.AAC.1